MTLPKRYRYIYDSSLSDLSNLSLAVWHEDSIRSIRNALKTLVREEEYDKTDFNDILASLVSVAKNTKSDPSKPQQNEVEMVKNGGIFLPVSFNGISYYLNNLNDSTR